MGCGGATEVGLEGDPSPTSSRSRSAALVETDLGAGVRARGKRGLWARASGLGRPGPQERTGRAGPAGVRGTALGENLWVPQPHLPGLSQGKRGPARVSVCRGPGSGASLPSTHTPGSWANPHAVGQVAPSGGDRVSGALWGRS